MTSRTMALAVLVAATASATPLLAQTSASSDKPTAPPIAAALPEAPVLTGPARPFQDQARTLAPSQGRQLVPPPARTAPSE